MKSSLLNDYILENLESLVQNLSLYIKDKKPESLHRLRVDIKKVRAVYSFAEYVLKIKLDTTLLKQLFLKGGKLREMYIHILLLSSIPNPPQKMINQLKKKENILIQQFVKKGVRYIMLIENFRKKTSLPKIDLHKTKIIKYFNKQAKKANKILKNINREDLHRYRKKIKKLMYIYNALSKRMQSKIELNKAEINDQQKMLGDWHDTYSAITFLSHEPLSTKTPEYILNLKEKEKRQFSTLLKNLKKNG